MLGPRVVGGLLIFDGGWEGILVGTNVWDGDRDGPLEAIRDGVIDGLNDGALEAQVPVCPMFNSPFVAT